MPVSVTYRFPSWSLAGFTLLLTLMVPESRRDIFRSARAIHSLPDEGDAVPYTSQGRVYQSAHADKVTFAAGKILSPAKSPVSLLALSLTANALAQVA